MEKIEQQKVGQIVASNWKTAKVFTSYGIDFCCGGGVTLQSVCKSKGLDVDQVTQEIAESMRLPDAQRFEELGVRALVDLIENVHHHYVRTTMPALATYLDKLCRVHGERHPELFEIKRLFEQTEVAMDVHMKKEELVLFPYLKAMEESVEKGFSLATPHFGSVENPIRMMEDDHTTEGVRFQRISELSQHYTSPADGCQTYKVAYSLLQEFEEDLHKHIHLENNLLFPKARKLFAELQPS